APPSGQGPPTGQATAPTAAPPSEPAGPAPGDNPAPSLSDPGPAVDGSTPPPPVQKEDSKMIEVFLLALIAGLVAGWFVPLIRRKR
ncbi:MAG: hypothetical protein VX519_08040, partial [Myxococcota bacterium]|nr:hypothetical protein [Myxococcota bacterium]